MTPLQACKETRELWTKMANYSVGRQRIVQKEDIPGPWEDYIHNCPCCMYIHRLKDCCFCPMLPEWQYYSTSLKAPCELSNSPYKKWSNLDYLDGTLCIDVEFFCLLIAEMADEAIERLVADATKKQYQKKILTFLD